MNIVLFGAGASAFCGDRDCPPLGAKLFNALQARGGAWAKLDSSYTPLFEDNFEKGMAEVIERERDRAPQARLMNEMACYLASFVPNSGNYYRQLWEVLDRSGRPFVLATLNYDMLVELALGGGKIAYDADGWGPGVPLLLKLHGSVNFLPAFNGIVTGGRYENVQSLFHGPVRFASREASIAFCESGQDLTPAMAMYEPRKKALVSPDALERYQKQWSVLVGRSSAIFLIGVSVAEQDSHVWEPLVRTKAPIYVVDPSYAQFEEWASRRQRPNVSSLCPKFGDCFELVATRLV